MHGRLGARSDHASLLPASWHGALDPSIAGLSFLINDWKLIDIDIKIVLHPIGGRVLDFNGTTKAKLWVDLVFISLMDAHVNNTIA